jgi:D-aminopeptidase
MTTIGTRTTKLRTSSSASASVLLANLENTINERIKELQSSKHQAHNPIYNESLTIQIETLHWVLAEILSLKRSSDYSTS